MIRSIEGVQVQRTSFPEVRRINEEERPSICETPNEIDPVQRGYVDPRRLMRDPLTALH